MKIAACFKVIYDIEKVIPEDFEIFDSTPDIEYVGRTLSCYDEVALESALRLKDIFNDIEITAISVGEQNSLIARKLYAVGVDKVVFFETNKVLFAAEQTANILSDYLKKEDYDFIFMGEKAPYEDSGLVPLIVSNNLNYHMYHRVTKFELNNDKIFKVICGENTEKLIINGKGKGVFTFANGEFSCLRFASLIDQIKSKNKPIFVENCVTLNENQKSLYPLEKKHAIKVEENIEKFLIEIIKENI